MCTPIESTRLDSSELAGVCCCDVDKVLALTTALALISSAVLGRYNSCTLAEVIFCIKICLKSEVLIICNSDRKSAGEHGFLKRKTNS